MIWNDFFGKIVMTVLISMVPVLELRGAIPIALSHDLPIHWAFGAAVIGNLLPVPFIMLFVRKIFDFFRKISPRLHRWIEKLENRAIRKSSVVKKFSTLGLFILVAVPLPGTGAWTGALVAAMLNMRIRRAFPAIALGVIAAGLIVLTASLGVGAVFG